MKIIKWLWKALKSLISFLIQIPAIILTGFGILLFGLAFLIKDSAASVIVLKELINVYLSKK